MAKCKAKYYMYLKDPDGQVKLPAMVVRDYEVNTTGWLRVAFSAIDGTTNHALYPPHQIHHIGWATKD